jgi:hypothetical protein
LELKRKRDRRKAAAERWYADHRERDEAGRQGAVGLAATNDEAWEGGAGDEVDEEEDEEEDELEQGYSREEWAQLRRVLVTQGSLVHDFQRELARKRQQDREERMREQEEEVEEEDDDDDQDGDDDRVKKASS